MSKTIPVSYENKHSYNIEIEQDFLRFIMALKAAGLSAEKKVCIVTDSNVSKLYAGEIKALLAAHYSFCTVFEFAAGEESKHLDTVNALYAHLITHAFDRKDFIVALGGGVTGDITGFAAATYLRGIDFVQVPTTLLAQVDSSIGGKTGVDYLKYKNMIGCFNMPRLVYINPSVLMTLPQQQFASGMGEVIKHGLIKDEDYFAFINNNSAKILHKEYEVLASLIEISCRIKGDVVERDPKEQAERALLNFGHTIGHAIEKHSEFLLTHGACVALGMISAAYLSVKLGHLSHEKLQLIEQVIQTFALPTRVKLTELPVSFSAADILATTRRDKKMEAGRIKFILLSRIGSAYITKELNEDQLLAAIEYILLENGRAYE